MSELRDSMEKELKSRVVPALRASGFKGSFPHFRRLRGGTIHLLTFQFDRYGGGFVIEISRCPPEGITAPWGKAIPASKVTTWDMPSDQRARLTPRQVAGTDYWFRYDNGNVRIPADQVLECLPSAEDWWLARAA
jgi:hypothetical protein